MGWNGSGGYSRTHNFSADGSAGIKILASRMDAEINDVGSAITIAVARNGQNTPSTNLPMGGYIHTNVGAAASAENYLRAKEYIRDVPIYVTERSNSQGVIRVSVDYYASVSAGQSPPNGSKLVVLLSSNKGDSAVMHLLTPLNNSTANTPHIAPIYSRGRALDPGALRTDQIYEFRYDSSASAWRVINPSYGFGQSYDAIFKAYAANGTLAGTDQASVVVLYSRIGGMLFCDVRTTVSVSTSISAEFFVLSASGVTALTSGIQGRFAVPVLVKDTPSPAFAARISQGSPGNKQIMYHSQWDVAGTTVSAACTVKVAPGTLVFSE